MYNIHILQEFRTQITNLTNRYNPKFSNSSYEIELPMPLPKGYTIVGGCGAVIKVTDYDYNSRYLSDVKFSLEDPTADFEVTGLKSNGKDWDVILKTTNTFKIENSLTVTLVATVSIFCRVFISKYTPTETPCKELFIYNSSTIHVLILLPHVLFR